MCADTYEGFVLYLFEYISLASLAESASIVCLFTKNLSVKFLLLRERYPGPTSIPQTYLCIMFYFHSFVILSATGPNKPGELEVLRTFLVLVFVVLALFLAVPPLCSTPFTE